MSVINFIIFVVVDAFALGFLFGVLLVKMKSCKRQFGDYNIFNTERGKKV